MNGMAELARRVWAIANALSEDGPPRKHGYESRQEEINDFIEYEAGRLSSPWKNNRPDSFESTVAPTAFGDHVSYIHNEFNFDPARPLRDYCLVSHISFLPVFKFADVNELSEGGLDPAILHAHKEIFEELKKQTVHLSKIVLAEEDKVDNKEHEAQQLSDSSPLYSRFDEFSDQMDSFRGGKDSIIKEVNLYSFQDRYITTLRSIQRMYDYIRKSFATDPHISDLTEAAHTRNKELDFSVTHSGKSSRLSMMREYFLRLAPSGASATLNWVRHHSQYQTLTAIEDLSLQEFASADPRALSAVPSLTTFLQKFRSGQYKNSENATGQTTAFDSLPSNWATHLFGRYLQGANYTIMPLGELFTSQFLRDCNAFAPAGPRSLIEEWALLLNRFEGTTTPCRKVSEITEAKFRELWEKGSGDVWARRSLAAFLNGLLQPLMATIGAASTRRDSVEFSLVSVSNDAAIILTDLQNFSSPKIKDDESNIYMSQTYIFDLGMNEFERGRLLKRFTDFSTQRYVALSDLPTFRFLHDALDVVQAELGLTIKRWLVSSGKSPNDDPAALPVFGQPFQTPMMTEERSIDANRSFIKELERVTVKLTILNDLIDGGISNRASSVSGSVDRLHRRIDQLIQRPLPGFMSLDDFLDRRFSRDVGAIASVGRRYEMIRRRVGELSNLVGANVEIVQNDEQKSLLRKVDRLTLFGIIYYFGSIAAYIVGPIALLFLVSHIFDSTANDAAATVKVVLAHPTAKEVSLEDMTDWVKFGTCLILVVIGVFIGKEVLSEIVREVGEGVRDWRRTFIPTKSRQPYPLFLRGRNLKPIKKAPLDKNKSEFLSDRKVAPLLLEGHE